MQRYSWTNNRAAGIFGRALPGRYHNGVLIKTWSTFSPHRSKSKSDAALRTLAGISVAHWVSHFHLFVLPMLFPFLKEQLGVGYIELGFALTVFGVGVRPDPGADRLSRRSYRRPQGAADRPHRSAAAR